jgi:methionyl-tRNA synthetase
MGKETFYVTTPIYYGTAKPHLGSLYSTLIADVINRWQKLKGKETFFLTGTDEHGQKIAQAAQKAGMTPKQFVDSFIAAYKGTWNTYDIDYSLFIRTTDPYHIKGVQDLITKLKKQGDIYKDTYQGWYCTPCETFVTSEDGKMPLCPTCGRETVAVTEESYFFKVSAYQDKLLEFYKSHPDFILPHMRLKEVTSFVESGLKDLSISRTTISWGVPFPGDSEHVVYVWVDALCNYITALGYGDASKQKQLDKFWPANVQVLGKDIVRFHGVYWPAMLMAAGLKPPHHLLVHGWIQINQQKMSKSRGNAVDPDALAAAYGVDEVRYYLMRQIPVNTDGEFSIADLEQRITSDLANDLGNLLNRMTLLAQKNGLTKVTASSSWQSASIDLKNQAESMLKAYQEHMDRYEFHLALAELWKFINQVNSYFHTQEPWKIVKTNKHLFDEIISATCHGLRIIAILLLPVMPKKMSSLLASIGQSIEQGQVDLKSLELTKWQHSFTITPIEPLFKKIEPSKDGKETMAEQTPVENYITIDDLIKVELRVGTIKEAVAVEGSDKLLKMQVDLGPLGVRQILAGIAKSYSPDQLINRQGIFVCNLKPRMMLGFESQGMMLIAPDENKKVELLSARNPVPNGTRLQ